MAPTKPLVAQQIESCFNVMGIPQEDTKELTGSVNVAERKNHWTSKRVFFLTPQVMVNLARCGLYSYWRFRERSDQGSYTLHLGFFSIIGESGKDLSARTNECKAHSLWKYPTRSVVS